MADRAIPVITSRTCVCIAAPPSVYLLVVVGSKELLLGRKEVPPSPPAGFYCNTITTEMLMSFEIRIAPAGYASVSCTDSAVMPTVTDHPNEADREVRASAPAT